MSGDNRMAQTTQWLAAILDYIKKMKSSISMWFLAVRLRKLKSNTLIQETEPSEIKPLLNIICTM